MEDGRIIKVCIDECGDKQFASLLFDITGWIGDSESLETLLNSMSMVQVSIDGKCWSPDREQVEVIDRNRFGRYAIESVPVSLIEKVRTQRIYKPTVLEIMNYEEAVEGWTWWKRTSADRSRLKI